MTATNLVQDQDSNLDVRTAWNSSLRRTPKWAGDYAYEANDFTSHAGKLYRAKVANTNRQPDLNPSDWEAFADLTGLMPFTVQGRDPTVTDNNASGYSSPYLWIADPAGEGEDRAFIKVSETDGNALWIEITQQSSTNFVPTTRKITAVPPLKGFGDFSQDRLAEFSLQGVVPDTSPDKEDCIILRRKSDGAHVTTTFEALFGTQFIPRDPDEVADAGVSDEDFILLWDAGTGLPYKATRGTVDTRGGGEGGGVVNEVFDLSQESVGIGDLTPVVGVDDDTEVATLAGGTHGRSALSVIRGHIEGSLDLSSVPFDDSGGNLSGEDLQAALEELGASSAPVDSVHGRTGAVVAAASDYSADQVDYDNTASGLSSTQLQAAIDELDAAIDSLPSAPSVPVDSVFGRTGAVVAAGSDYDASQVDYDNATSGLTADQVQAAIDEIEGRVDTLEASGGGGGAVSSVFGRTGAVVAASSDYDANQVDYDNTSSGMSATEVQAAIDELDAAIGAIPPPPAVPVDSIHGRTGAVVSVSGDYDADQVDYDNASSGLTATEVQAAIDELDTAIGAIPAAPVTSVHGRTGVVAAAASDYDADQVDFDNTASGMTATEVQAALDELHIKHNFLGTAVPDKDTNDQSEGYDNGSLWYYGATRTAWVFTDDGAGNKFWRKITPVRHRFGTNATPGADDDEGERYGQSSFWIEVDRDLFFVCTSHTEGAATWHQVNARMGVAESSAPGVGDDIDNGYKVGSIYVHDHEGDDSHDEVYVASQTDSGAAVYHRIGGHTSWVEANRTATQAVSGSGYQDVLFNANEVDDLGEYATGTGIFSPIAAGEYIFDFSVAVTLGTIVKLKVLLIGGDSFEFEPASSSHGNGSITLRLTDTNTVKIQGDFNDGSATVEGAAERTWLRIRRIG